MVIDATDVKDGAATLSDNNNHYFLFLIPSNVFPASTSHPASRHMLLDDLDGLKCLKQHVSLRHKVNQRNLCLFDILAATNSRH